MFDETAYFHPCVFELNQAFNISADQHLDWCLTTSQDRSERTCNSLIHVLMRELLAMRVTLPRSKWGGLRIETSVRTLSPRQHYDRIAKLVHSLEISDIPF
jgi:hypothetical protein